MKPIWIWRSEAQNPYQIHSHRITPIVRSAGFHWPNSGSFVGVLWQFPQAIEIEDSAAGSHQRMSVPDPTRTVVWFLVALSLLFVITMALMRRTQFAHSQK